MSEHWERSLKVDEPVVTKPFIVLSVLVGIALILTVYREIMGLGYVTGLNDGYSWGMFKNFNVTTLTALGSAGYAVGVLTWLFNRRRYHILMRTSALISILAYTTGMLALTVDVGRPWNLLWIFWPGTWNRYSILLEVAVCMTAYVILALSSENIPAFVERWLDNPKSPVWAKRPMRILFDIIRRTYPFIIGLAFILPSMHQSSLGALMMMAGPRVHPLWQTSLLPFLYLIMAYVLGFSAVIGILMVSCMIWKRPLDMVVLSRLGYITGLTAMVWLAFRVGDVAGRGALHYIFQFNSYSFFFLLEIILVSIPAWGLMRKDLRQNPTTLYGMLVILTVGGLMYRFFPTTIAFIPGDRYFYFPSLTELLMSGGYVALALIGYLYTVKRYNILPVPLSTWFKAQQESTHAHPAHS